MPIAVTALASAAFLGLQWIPVPGLPPALASVLNVGSLGLGPILAAFIVVEVVAAAVPGWRQLRNSAEGRVRLRRLALMLALVIALGQTFGIVRYAESIRAISAPSLFRPGAADPRLALWLCLPLGVAVAMALAALIDVAGVGVGYSVLIATGWGFVIARGVVSAVQQSPDDPPVRFFLFLGIFCAAAWKMLATKPYEGSRARYRLPTPGLEPVHYGVLLAIYALQTNLARSFVPRFEAGWALRGLQLLATLGWCAFFTRVLHRPATTEDRAALSRAGRASTLWLAALTVGSWLVDDAAVSAGSAAGGNVLQAVALIAVGMDVAGELRAGCRRVLRTLHRLEDADALSAALGAAGIGTALRGAHHRALYQFFAPFIPIGVLVAEADLERAEVVAVEHERAAAAPPPMPDSPEEGALAPG